MYLHHKPKTFWYRTNASSFSNRCSYSKENSLQFGTTLTISNKEMNITKIVKSLEESAFLIKGVSEIIKNEAKESQKGGSDLLSCY